MTAPLLEVQDLEAFYGDTRALHRFSFSVAKGGVTAILGANGAGKTTTLRAISGLVRRQGKIILDGVRIDRLGTERIAALGVGHVPDGRGTFESLSAEENLRIGGYLRRSRSEFERDLERVYGYFPVLSRRRAQQAGTLSGGEQQMLAIGRALMLRPRLLLLDEPSFGFAPRIVAEIYRILRSIREQDQVGILLVEQNANLALDFADAATLIETGNVVLAGTAAQLKADQSVRRAYLGA